MGKMEGAGISFSWGLLSEPASDTCRGHIVIPNLIGNPDLPILINKDQYPKGNFCFGGGDKLGIEQTISGLSERVRNQSDAMLTEEAVKTAVVLPFLQSLGYDVFNPDEVIPEFSADAVGKKGEKVDYAIKIDGQIRILIECKPISTDLASVHLAQLYRYFSVTQAKFAILTNGRIVNFHSDLEEPNKLDSRPFLAIDLAEVQSHQLNELKKFEKSGFDLDGILASAERLKYTSALKAEISKLMEDPPKAFVKMVAAPLYDGHFTTAVVDRFTGLVKAAFRDMVRESVQNKLSSALAGTEQAEEDTEASTSEIVTTDEEREAYMVIKAITRGEIKASRVFMRDQKSYCAIIVDDNNRKPLVRLHFNGANKYIGLFDGEKEERVLIKDLDNLYDYSERLLATAAKYAE